MYYKVCVKREREDFMPEIAADELVPGEVYVTRGGTIVMKGDPNKKRIPWGYERVRFMRLTKKNIVVETPWGTECELPLDYPLCTTSETHLRSEFPVSGVHEDREVLPFDKALKEGISKELSSKELQKLAEAQEGEVSPKRATVVARNEFTEKFIKYFEKPQTLSGASKHFGVAYQKIRYHLNKVRVHGYGLQRFQIVTTKDKPTKTQIVRL